jgi:glycosyltransferase involved in cell wall biosynthesis
MIRSIASDRTPAKRIVMFSPGFLEVGGAAKRSRLIATGMADRGWDVKVISRAGTYRRPRLARRENLTVVELPGFGRRRIGMLLYMSVAVPLGLLWSRRDSTLLAVQLMSTSVAAGVCSVVRGRRYLAWATTSGELSESAYIRTASLGRLRRWLMSRASFLIAQTPAVAEELAGLFTSTPISILPNPVELLAEPPGHNRQPIALFAGRFSEEKGLFCLLEAWRSVAQGQPGARLILAGEGGHYRSVETELRRQVAEDPVLRSTVSFVGWVPSLRQYLAGADVFVLPSTSEGMSNSLLEACAAHRIVVASDIPSNRAVLSSVYPLCFTPSDSTSLANALREAFELEGERRAAVVESIRSISEQFSLPTVLSRLEDMIDAANSPRN